MSFDASEIARLRALCANGIDCGDNSCRFIRERSGMRTNGGCRCVRDEQKPGTISKLSAVWRAMPAALDEIERLRAMLIDARTARNTSCVVCGKDTGTCGVVDHLERFCSLGCAEKKYPINKPDAGRK